MEREFAELGSVIAWTLKIFSTVDTDDGGTFTFRLLLSYSFNYSLRPYLPFLLSLFFGFLLSLFHVLME